MMESLTKRLVKHLWVTTCLTVSFGCSAKAPSSPTCEDVTRMRTDSVEMVTLIDQDDWHLQTPEEDVLSDHIPADFHCVPNPTFIEEGDLEFQTEYCNYLSLEQDSKANVLEGEPVRIGIFHFDLTAPEPAQAHVAVLFEDELQWEQWIDIPGPANVIEACFTATRDLPLGAPLTVHFHNHGQNTWALTHVQTLAP